jgi:hypothetical protein
LLRRRVVVGVPADDHAAGVGLSFAAELHIDDGNDVADVEAAGTLDGAQVEIGLIPTAPIELQEMIGAAKPPPTSPENKSTRRFRSAMGRPRSWKF